MLAASTDYVKNLLTDKICKPTDIWDNEGNRSTET